MTAPWEEYAAPAGPWEEYSNSAEAQPYTGTGIRQTAKRTALGTLKDTGVALAKGVVGAGEAAVGLADIVTPGNLGEGLRKHVGYDPAVAQQFLSSQYSQPQQEAIQRVEDAEGFTGTVKAALQNPSVIASTVGESLPSMIGGQFLARAGLRTLPRAAAALGTYAPVVAGALGEGAVTAGSMQENIRQQAGDTTLAQKGAALAAGAGTALLGAVGGRIAQKFGFIDPDTFLLSIGSKQTTPGVIKRIIGGGISESVFEEMPQSAQEQVWLNAATGKPLTEGLGESVALGGLAGAAMGAGFNVMQPRTQEKLDTVQQRTLSNLIKGAQVSVSGGVATIVEEGKLPVTMQVKDLAEHLASGGTMDTLTPEQRFGKDVAEKTQFLGSQPAVVGRPETAVGDVQADIFGREALAYNQERNRPRGLVTGEGQGIRSRVPGRTAEEVAAEEAAYQNQPINVPPGAEQGLRAIASGATTVPAFQRDADVVTAPMAAQTDIYNKDRNRPRGLVTPAKSEQQPAVSRVPGVSAEEVLAAEQAYRAYQTGQEPAQAPKPITRSDGKPFSTERTAGVAMKRLGLKAEEVEVRPVTGGFVVVAKTSDSVDKTSGTQYSTSEGSYNSRPVRNYDAGRDVSAEAKEAITVLNQALNVGRTGAQAGSTITPRRVVSTVQSTANRIAAAFGRRVVFFASSDPAAVLPNGFIDKADPRTIYINTESGFSPVTVIGHEILHALRTEREELYNQILEAARGNFKEDMRAQYKARLAKSKYHETRAITEDYLNEEMIADYLGDSFSDPKFWEALAKRKPSVFEQMSYYVVNFLNRLIDHFAGQQKNFQSDLFFKDLVKMRKAVLDAAEQYGGAEAWIGMGVPEFRFSRAEIVAHAKAFYSKLQQVASDKFQGMKAQSVLPFLQKQGVKKQEIEAVGVAEWLAGKKPTDKVTQQELLDFVRANTVELEDVVLGEGLEPLTKNEERIYNDLEAMRRANAFTIPGQEEQLQELAARRGAYRDVVHFQQYTEPGAEEGSYREMFVTAPTQRRPPISGKLRFKQDQPSSVEVLDENGEFFGRYGGTVESVKAFLDEGEGSYWQDGHSQYSGIKNPVVRIRFNTVTTADGKRILRIEEMQGPNPDNQAKMPAYLKANIYQTGIKRILAYAKENGFDGVGFATRPGMSAGETQADRYSLEKQVDSINAEKTASGTYRLVVYGKEGTSVYNNRNGAALKESELEGLVGKELAGKIINQEPLSAKTYSGLDLKVGGEGLKKLYDTDLPRMLEAYGKGKMAGTDVVPTKNDYEKMSSREIGELKGPSTVPYLPITAQTPGSYPLFSTADGALKAGQQKVTSMVQSLTNPKSRLHELAVQYAPQWLSVTPLITLVQTFGKKIQQVNDFARHIDGVVATKTDIVDTAKVLYDKAIKLAQAGPGEKAFNYAAAVASFNRMRPWEGLFDQDWVPKTGTKEERLKMANVAWKRAGMDVATGKKLHEAHKEAVDAYEALGSEEVKQAYIAIVDDLKRVRAREKNNLLSYIEAATAGNPEMRAQLMARFNATFSELQGAYWPLARVGDFRLSFTDKDGAKVVKHYVTMKERRLDKEQLIADGIPAGAFVEDYKDKRTRNETAIPQELMNQLAGAVEAEYLKGVDLDDADAVASAREAAQDVVSDMNQIWLRWQPETSALKNSLRRKNTRGFSEDMMRSYLDYMSRHASNIAWTEQGRKIEQDLKSLADYIKEAQTTPGADTTMQRHILNDLRARVQAIRTARVGPVASGLGKLGTAYYMTSPSIALVQMSQLGVITLPKLATQFGWSRASKALAAGTKAAFTQAFTRKAIFEDPAVGNVFENIRAVVTAENRDLPQAKDKALGDRLYSKKEMLRQIEGLTPYQQQLLALREATARNLLDISAAHEAYELTQGKDPNGPVSKVFRYAMLPMQLSELASRKAAVLSTFDLANQDGKNFFDAMNDVSSVVNDTLYSYAKEHKGAALQGGAPRVLLQFQHYRIMTGIRLAQLFLNSVKGETPEVKTAARKELAGIMGMAGALGGSMGLPAAGGVFAIMNALLGTDDEPYDSELEWRNWLQENLGQTMGNVATTGLPYLLGADISRRVGMGDIFGMQQQPPPGVHGKQLAAWWAASMLGPVASVGQSWFQGYDEFSKGNYMKSLEVSTPKPIRDALKAYRVGTEGLKTSAGKKLLADEAIGADEVMLLALGFNADEVAQAQAAERSLNKMSTMISERRGKLIKAAARGILEGDTRDALGDVLEFNRRMPRFAVNGGDIKSAVRKQITGELGVTGPRDQAVADQWEIPSYL